MDGTCKVCGREIHWWGKERLYCSDACKQKMCRERREQEKQAQREVELIQLRARWKRLWSLSRRDERPRGRSRRG